MTALANNKMTYEQVQENVRVQAEADRATIAGPEINIRLSLSPRMILMLASPVAVLASLAIGWLILTSMAVPVYHREMIAAGIVNVVGGTLAALPLFFWMKRGAAAIAAGGLVGIAVRCLVILGGLMLAFGPGWNLAKMPTVYWVLGCYFPLLIAETAMVAWLCQRSKH